MASIVKKENPQLAKRRRPIEQRSISGIRSSSKGQAAELYILPKGLLPNLNKM
jgi:hypothetical protein